MQDDEVSDNNTGGSDDTSGISNSNPTPATTAATSAPTNDMKHLPSMVDMSVILPMYQELSPIASSRNTLVFTAVAHQSKRKVAVKRISIRNCSDLSLVKNMLREIKILRRLDHDNVVRISNVVLSTMHNASISSTNPNSLVHPKSSNDTATMMSSNFPEMPFDALYLEMELVDIDLRSILDQRKLSLSYVKLFSYQLLRGLKYIHSANVIHRDLTPSNIFINIDTLMLKIGDFGVSRIFDPSYDHTRHLSITTESSWYHAPEMMLTPGHYHRAVDIWAVGCIIAEMCTGSPLFPGCHSLEQMDLICKSVENNYFDWEAVISPMCSEVHCTAGDMTMSYNQVWQGKESILEKLGDDIDTDLLDLITKLLMFDPNKRISIDQALKHSAFDELSCMHDEPVCCAPFHIEDELDDVSLLKCQELLKMRANELVSIDSSGVDASTDDLLRSSLKSSVHGNSVSNTNKNLLELVRSGSSANPAGGHLDSIMSESEARKMACDFDYGVQIADGSVNRERMLMDWRPVSPETACFDPYKWNNETTKKEESDKQGEIKPTVTAVNLVPHEDDMAVMKARNKHPTDGVHDVASHSDHGYHSSYCSSNLSNGKPIHSHSLWSLSSPDVSIDHDHRGGPTNSNTTQRAATPVDHIDPTTTATGNNSTTYNTTHTTTTTITTISNHYEQEQVSDHQSTDHLPSQFQSPTEEDNKESSGKWKHKDDVIPHHHQNFHMSYHHHHYHHHGHHHHGHHHHHHHKHHRHSSRHGTSSTPSTQRITSSQHQELVSEIHTSSSVRVHQRHCLVEEVVQELAEESASSSDATVTSQSIAESAAGTTPQPSTGCKKRHHHHHHHRNNKSSTSLNKQDKPLKDSSPDGSGEATKNEKDFFKREPGYHERLNAEVEQVVSTSSSHIEANNNNNHQEIDDVNVVLAFPWATNAATTSDSDYSDTSQHASENDNSSSSDNNLILSSMQQHLKALQITTTSSTASSCASQSRVQSLEIPTSCRLGRTPDQQKKAKQRVECPY